MDLRICFSQQIASLITSAAIMWLEPVQSVVLVFQAKILFIYLCVCVIRMCGTKPVYSNIFP